MEPLATWRIGVQVGVVAVALLVCALRPMPLLRIVGLCIAALVGYGMLQDQVTARICPEYFTVGHPPIAGVQDPTVLGIAWGFLGSWWGGLFLGLAVAAAARGGSRPQLTAGQLLRPLAVLLAAMVAVTLVCGVGAEYNGAILGVSLGEPWASAVPAPRHRGLLVVASAHFGTYAAALIGGVVLCAWVVRTRRSPA